MLSVHLSLLESKLKLALLDFVVLVFDILVLSRFCLFQLWSCFFNKAFMFDQLLLSFSDLLYKFFLLRVQVNNVLLLVLKQVSKLSWLDHGTSQPVIRFINFVSSFVKHHLALGFVCEADLFPEGQLGHNLQLIFSSPLIDSLNKLVMNQVVITTFVPLQLLLFPSYLPLFLSYFSKPFVLCSPLNSS